MRTARSFGNFERFVPARVGDRERVADQCRDEAFLRAEVIIERRGVLLSRLGYDVAHRDGVDAVQREQFPRGALDAFAGGGVKHSSQGPE